MKILTKNPEQLPLQNNTIWCLFTENKLPVNSKDGSSTNNATAEFASTFTQSTHHNLSNDYYLGIVGSAMNNTILIDLDNCISQNLFMPNNQLIKSWAQPLVDFAVEKNFYIEESVSGTGLHIIAQVSGFDKAILKKHLYTKGDLSQKIKSEAIEIFLSTDTEKTKKNLLITGTKYSDSQFDSKTELPTITKNELIEVLKKCKATMLVQILTDKVIVKNFSNKDKKEINIEDIIASKDNFNVPDILNVALLDDRIRYLYNYEDQLGKSDSEIQETYPKLLLKFHYSRSGQNESTADFSPSGNDFLFLILMCNYTQNYKALAQILIESNRGSDPDRYNKMVSLRGNITYAEYQAKSALTSYLEKNDKNNDSGIIYMNYNAAINWMNSKYIKIQSNEKVEALNYFKDSEEGYTWLGPYAYASIKTALNNRFVVSKIKGQYIKFNIVDIWFGSPHSEIVIGYRFKPNENFVIKDKESGHNYFNTFRGFHYDPIENNELIETWLDYGKQVLCSDDEEDFEYLINYCAHIFQKPEELPGVALVLRSDEGVGKDLWLKPILKILGQKLYHDSSNANDFVGDFNSATFGKLLIVANEALFRGKHEIEDRLKALIASEDSSIQKKYQDVFRADNYIRLFILSNRASAINFDTKSRRFRFFKCNDDYSRKNVNNDPEAKAYQQKLIDLIYNNKNIDKFLSALLYYLKNKDISNFNPREFEIGKNAGVIRTESNNPVSKFFYDFIINGEFGINHIGGYAFGLVSNFDTIKTSYGLNEQLVFNPTELYEAYKAYCREYKLELKLRKDFKKDFIDLFVGEENKQTVPRKIEGKSVKVWILKSRFNIALEHGLDLESLEE